MVLDPLHARSIVLHEKKSDPRIANAIIDSCMIPRTMCDVIEQNVTAETGIKSDHILIAATHTHNAPSAMHYCLGTQADPKYSQFLPPNVVESVVRANEAVQPARAGWAVFDGNERDELLGGKTALPLPTWSHLVLVRNQDEAVIYLNGALEAAGKLVPTHQMSPDAFLGGRSDNFANLEGRLDEVALFDRALSAEEVKRQFEASGKL